MTILRSDKDAGVLLVRDFVKFHTKLHINMCYVRRGDLDSREAESENPEITTTLIIPFN